jgi:hypothetical protein
MNNIPFIGSVIDGCFSTKPLVAAAIPAGTILFTVPFNGVFQSILIYYVMAIIATVGVLMWDCEKMKDKPWWDSFVIAFQNTWLVPLVYAIAIIANMFLGFPIILVSLAVYVLSLYHMCSIGVQYC